MVQIVNQKEVATYKMMKHPKGMRTRVIVCFVFQNSLGCHVSASLYPHRQCLIKINEYCIYDNFICIM